MIFNVLLALLACVFVLLAAMVAVNHMRGNSVYHWSATLIGHLLVAKLILLSTFAALFFGLVIAGVVR